MVTARAFVYLASGSPRRRELLAQLGIDCRLLIDDDLAIIPELYDALLKHRNANWAPEIDTRGTR